MVWCNYPLYSSEANCTLDTTIKFIKLDPHKGYIIIQSQMTVHSLLLMSVTTGNVTSKF